MCWVSDHNGCYKLIQLNIFSKKTIAMKFLVKLAIAFFLLITVDPSFSQDKIDVLLINKNYEKALSEINSRIAKKPTPQLYLKKGMVYNNLQNYQEALNSFSEALLIDPDNLEILVEMAEGLSILGNNADAINYFEKAMVISPENLVIAGKLGRVYINQKDYVNGYGVFEYIYERDSSNIYWNKQYAYCSFKVFKRKQAAYLYEKVIEANPRDYGSYSNLIYSYDRKKEGNKVLAVIDKGLEQFPGDAELILERASYMFKIKRYEQAMINFEKYFAADGDSIYEIALNYGISSYFSQKEEKALGIFEDLYRANPNDMFVMYYQGLCYKKLKKFEEAEKMMLWAIEATVPEYVAEMYHHLGQIYGQERKFAESVSALEKSYEINPQKHEVLFEIATTYEEFNSNKTLALNYYQIYLKEAGEAGENTNYAMTRITKIKEDMFFDE